MKRPAFQFYPSDWLNSLDLRQCSALSRALWIDMICLMHEGQPYGHLRTAAGNIEIGFLARISGITTAQVVHCLSELKSFGIYSVDDQGTLFSRRMVRDEKIRESRASGGGSSQLNLNVPRSRRIPQRIAGRISLEASLEASLGVSLGVSPSSSSSTSFNTPLPPKAKELPDALSEGWKKFIGRYPNQIKVNGAAQAWISLVASGEISEANVGEVLEGLDRWINSAQWERDGGKFIPAPTTFLIGNAEDTGRRWKDHPPMSEEARQERRVVNKSSAGRDPYAEYVRPAEWVQEEDDEEPQE